MPNEGLPPVNLNEYQAQHDEQAAMLEQSQSDNVETRLKEPIGKVTHLYPVNATRPASEELRAA